MSVVAYTVIKDGALHPADRARFRAAYDEVWALVESRIRKADDEFVRRLAGLIVATGNRRPDADASEIARIVAKTFQVPNDQE
jgi:hypothetical protein